MNRRTKTSVWTGIGILFCLLNAGTLRGEMPAANNTVDTTVVTFRFVPEQDMFYIPWAGNGAQLERLYVLLDEYRSEITAGRMPVYVDGYCVSLPTYKENLQTAYVRANRVKSELITRKGLKEADFITSNHAVSYDGKRDVVVVTLRIPATPSVILSGAKDLPLQSADTVPRTTDSVDPAADTVILNEVKDLQPQSAKDEVLHSVQNDKPAQNDKISVQNDAPAPYTFALRTNLLYDAFLLPTLGIEWRINRNVGIRLDGSLSRWGGTTGKVQKTWFLNPEVRWYLLENRRFYLGASATYGEYNLYGYPLGNLLLKDDTGYQGTLWNAGLTLGYQLRLAPALSLDFNLGLGYTHSAYDSFTLIDRTRVYRDRNRTKHLWGPTQAGISLVWTINGKQ